MYHTHLHGKNEFYCLLGKVWCIRFGHDSSSTRWKCATKKQTWQIVDVPQQQGGWECAYFTMKYTITYIEGVCKLGFEVDEVKHCSL